jgi:hypothetical protein
MKMTYPAIFLLAIQAMACLPACGASPGSGASTAGSLPRADAAGADIGSDAYPAGVLQLPGDLTTTPASDRRRVVEIDGDVTAVISDTEFEIDGQPVLITDETEYGNGGIPDISKGMRLEVAGSLNADEKLVARTIECNPAGEVETETREGRKVDSAERADADLPV